MKESVEILTKRVNMLEAELVKGQVDFLNLAIHDLLAPLRKLRTFIDMLGENRPDLKNDPYFTRTVATLGAMSILFDELSLLVELESAPIHPVHCDCNKMMREAADKILPNDEEAGIELNISKLTSVWVDESQCRLLFEHLLRNCAQSKAEGRPLIIEVISAPVFEDELKKDGLKGNYEKIMITDNGKGFDVEADVDIFTPFIRHERNAVTGNKPVGLAMCRQVAINHNGQLKAESTEDGNRFILLLPSIKEDDIYPGH